jgi:hypothetical protein
MSALQFLTSGGMANTGGDLPETERKTLNDVVKSLGEQIRTQARGLQVPASALTVWQAPYLLIARDTANYHVLFANAPGGTQLRYRDLTQHGRLQLDALAHQVRVEVGDTVWGFSYAVGLPAVELEKLLKRFAKEYLESIIQVQQTAGGRLSDEAVSNPEIASGLEKFKKDHSGKKTAFIMMQFASTKAHNKVVSSLKTALAPHGIVALRADDKQYMDDLFPNVKVYMHGCDFGIAVFERITADDFNPNVSLEVGYMIGMRKDVLLLKDSTLKTLPTDLTGRLYREFDTQDISTTVPSVTEKWLRDKGLIK